MSKFFNEIVAPQLTQTDYGLGIENMVNNINANFQKVFTLPFLKGDDGDRLTTRFCPFWDSSDPNTAKLTEEGYKIFEAIFIDDKIKDGIKFENTKPGCTLGNLMTDLAGLFTNSENSGRTQFEETYGPKGDPKILLYYLIDTESNNETLLGAAQLYYFFDPRIQGLSDFIGANNTESVEGFVDYTCILSTKYVNGDSEYSYAYEKQSGWPTLYFDSSSKQFCWQINGQKTGVNAQGVNGRDGRGSKIWLCVVKPTVPTEAGQTVSTNVGYGKGKYTKFEIIDIWVPKLNTWLNINDGKDYETASNALGESGMPSSGDVFIAYLYSEGKQSIEVPVYTIVNGVWLDSGETEIFNKPPMSIYGTLFYDALAKDGKKYHVFSNISQNLYRTTDNTVLVDMLNHIGDYTGDNSNTSTGVQDPVYKAKGLFVPLRETTESVTHEYVHVLYNNSRDNGSLNLKVDKLENVVDAYKSMVDEPVHEKKNLNIIYNTKVDGTTTLSSGLDLLNSQDMNVYCTWGNKDEWGASANASYILTHYHEKKSNSDWVLGMSLRINHDSLIICNQLKSDEYALQVNVLDKTVYTGGKLTVSSDGADITGATTITGTTTIRSAASGGNSIVVNTTDATITGTTTIRSAASGGNSIVVNANGVAITGATTLNSTLSVDGKLTAKGGVLFNVAGKATSEYSSDLSTLLGATGGYIYMGGTPTDKLPMNKLVINRHAILAYTTYGKGGALIDPEVSFFYLNPAGGTVEIPDLKAGGLTNYIKVTDNGVGINTNPAAGASATTKYVLNVRGNAYINGDLKFNESYGVILSTANSWTNVDRCIPFTSPDDATKVSYVSDNFMYNPKTNKLTVGNIDVEQLYVNTNENTVGDFDPGNYNGASLVVTGDSYQGNILPNKSNLYTLGSENLKWSKVWSSTFNGDLNGRIYLNNDDDSNKEHSIVFASIPSTFSPHSLYTDSSNFKYNPSSGTLTVENLKVIGDAGITGAKITGATITGSLTVNGGATFNGTITGKGANSGNTNDIKDSTKVTGLRFNKNGVLEFKVGTTWRAVYAGNGTDQPVRVSTGGD